MFQIKSKQLKTLDYRYKWGGVAWDGVAFAWVTMFDARKHWAVSYGGDSFGLKCLDLFLYFEPFFKSFPFELF